LENPAKEVIHGVRLFGEGKTSGCAGGSFAHNVPVVLLARFDVEDDPPILLREIFGKELLSFLDGLAADWAGVGFHKFKRASNLSARSRGVLGVGFHK
jgi:hypothetical protein